AAVLVNGAIWRVVLARFDMNPALLSALSAAAFALIISTVILQVAARVGGQIDRAEAERDKAQEQLRAWNQQLERRVAERTAELARMNGELQQEIVERTRAEQGLHAQYALAHVLAEATTLEEAGS